MSFPKYGIIAGLVPSGWVSIYIPSINGLMLAVDCTLILPSLRTCILDILLVSMLSACASLVPNVAVVPKLFPPCTKALAAFVANEAVKA